MGFDCFNEGRGCDIIDKNFPRFGPDSDLTTNEDWKKEDRYTTNMAVPGQEYATDSISALYSSYTLCRFHIPYL